MCCFWRVGRALGCYFLIYIFKCVHEVRERRERVGVGVGGCMR